jgi:hypothetical protein
VTSDTDWPGIWSPAVRWRSDGPDWKKISENRDRTSTDADK